MGRPPMSVGTAGRVRIYPTVNGFMAQTRFRDYDGKNRFVERSARTRGGAERALADAIRDRVKSTNGGPELTPATLVGVLAEAWWKEIESSQRSPGTKRLYRDRLDRQIIPALGNLRLRELTVGTVDRHLKAVTSSNGGSVAKAVRSVLGGMCKLACAHDAMDRNPVRDASPLSVKSKRRPRALTIDEIRQLRRSLSEDPKAVTRDLPDFVDMMLASGLRVGETAAITWSTIDLERGTARVGEGIVVRVARQGLVIRAGDSTKLSPRLLLLPSWCLEMLRRRWERRIDENIVFTAPMGGLRDPSNSSADLKEAFVAAGFDWVTSHTFRRTVATLMSYAGLASVEAADQLGHSRPSMTADHYFNRAEYITSGAAVLEILGDESH